MSQGMAWTLINPTHGLSYTLNQAVGEMQGKLVCGSGTVLAFLGLLVLENVNKVLNSSFTIRPEVASNEIYVCRCNK